MLQKAPLLSNPKTRAMAMLWIALLALAFVPILIRLAEREIRPDTVIFHRFWMATAILVAWNGLRVIKTKLSGNSLDSLPSLSPQILGLLLGAGISLAATQVTWAWSLNQTSIANSAFLHSLTPMFSTLLGWALFSQNFDRRFILGTIVAIIGSAILGVDDFINGIGKIQGDAIALSSAFFLSVYLLLVEQVRQQKCGIGNQIVPANIASANPDISANDKYKNSYEAKSWSEPFTIKT